MKLFLEAERKIVNRRNDVDVWGKAGHSVLKNSNACET